MQITNNVYQLECAKHCHVYLIKADEMILIDTGLPGLSNKILSELKEMGILPKDVNKILLTHHDVDHIGNAKKLQDMTGAQIWAPKLDVPYIIGEKKREGIKRVIETIMPIGKPSIEGNYDIQSSFGEIRTIAAPGHTPGHTMFLFQRVLFTGDLFRVNKGEVKIMPRFMNWKHEELVNSISIIKTLDYDWICPSHSEPIKRDDIHINY